MKRNRLRNVKEAQAHRTAVLIQQRNIDPIINKAITDPCLDHQHFGEQRCRGVLQREVNSFEGKVQNAFNRYIKHLTDESISDVLRRLADYLEQDYTQNPVHHTALTNDVNKFKRLSAQEQKQMLLALQIQPGINTVQRSKQYRDHLKRGTNNV